MAFSTWSALYSAMLDDMTADTWRRKSYTINGNTVSFESFSEFQKRLEFVRRMADAESGAQVRRTCAVPGGRG